MSQTQAENKKIGVGDRAPDFTLPSQDGTPVSLHDLLGTQAVVMYFYPKDNTSGCTAEACAFRDSYEVFKEAGATVVGISSDSVESHAGFASKNRLPFILLSDAGGAVRKAYGVPRALAVLPGRVTYVIDKGGVVRHMFSDMLGATKHVGEALQALRALDAPEQGRSSA